MHLRADLLEEALFGELSGRAREHHLLLDELVEEAWLREPARGRPVRIGALGEAMLCNSLAHRVPAPLRGMAGTPGLRRSLRRFFHAAGVAGLSAATMRRLVQRAGERAPAVAQKLQALADLYQSYRGFFGSRLADEATVFRRGLLALQKVPPPSLQEGDLDVLGMALVPAAAAPTLQERLVAIGALVSAGTGAGAPRTVRVHVPDADGRPLLEAALAPVLSSLYTLHDLNLEEVRVPLGPFQDQSTAWGRFLGRLFQPQPPLQSDADDRVPAAELSFLAAPNPVAEAQGVARAARDLIDCGVAPSTMGIVVQDPSRQAMLASALRRYGVPFWLPLPAQPDAGGPPAPAPPLQVLLGIYRLVERDLPREEFVQLLCSRYLHWGTASAAPWRLARALREAGIRDLRLGRSSAPAPAEADYERRLREWQQRQGQEGRVRPLLEAALNHLRLLPETASLPVHAAALARLCEQLRFWDRCLEPGTLPPPAASVEDALALARDQEVALELRELLAEVPRLAQLQGLHRDALDRDAFAQLLGDLAAEANRAASLRGVAGTAAVLGDLGTIAGRRLRHLFVTGLTEGELPGRAAEDPLLSDEERRLCNRLLGRDVFPLARHGDVQAPLLFAQALCHSRAAHLSYALCDDNGRPLPRSSFVAEALRAAARPEPERGEFLVIPYAEQARTPAELWTRAAFDRCADPDPRRPWQPGRQAAGPGQALFTALSRREPARTARLLSIIAIERERARFFAARAAGRSDAASPFVGRLADAELRQRLSHRLPGSPQHPLSASALEDYAKCPFRFFLRRVLKAVPIQEGGDELDPMAGGRLYHLALERFFKDRKEQGRLPLRPQALSGDLAALSQIIDSVLDEWGRTESTGHQGLFAVQAQRMREDLARMIEREARQPIEPGCVPHLFEHEFGPLFITSRSDEQGLPLAIKGYIDRVDIGAGHAVVLDYKAGRLDRYEGLLRRELLSTSFQLPLYAAALRADPQVTALGIERVSARYYSLRQGRPSQGKLDDQIMISLEPQAQAQHPERNVAEVAYRLWRRLRDGDFRVDPRTCEGCGLEGACRISLTAAPAPVGNGA